MSILATRPALLVRCLVRSSFVSGSLPLLPVAWMGNRSVHEGNIHITSVVFWSEGGSTVVSPSVDRVTLASLPRP